MATNDPQKLENLDWQVMQAGPWTGSIQNVGNAPVVGRVVADPDEPIDGAGGFSVLQDPTQIVINAGETLYCRATAVPAVVVLA